MVGLLGPNGAGKTTSFYMIVGLVRADAGEISIDGQSVEHMPIHRRSRLGLSYLPQEASIFRKLNVEENVRAVLELQRDAEGKPFTRAEIDRRLTLLLQELRVDHLRDSPGPWRPSRASSCWTSRSPASTRSPSSRSSASSATSSRAASAC